MLKLELRKPASFVDRALVQALGWSLLLHVVLFSTFRIRLSDYHDKTPQMLPINLSLEPDEPQAQVNIYDPEHPGTSSLFTSNLDPEEWQSLALQVVPLPKTYEKVPPPLPSDTHSSFSQDEIHALSPSLSLTHKIYPLQLKMSKELKALTLVEDGSSLFREKGPYDDLGRYVLAATHLPIEYKVAVSGSTGKIYQAERKDELLDKELQVCADRLITCISFEPFSQKKVEGSCTLIFCADGEEVKGLMHD